MKKEFKSKFATKVLFNHAYQNSIWYSLDCSCGEKEHQSMIEIEYNKKANLLSLHFYQTLYYNKYFGYDANKSFIKQIRQYKNVILKRIKDSMRLLFTGYLKIETDLLIENSKHINDFIEALQEGRDYLIGDEGGK